MPTAIVKAGSTSLTVVGGSDKTFSPDGVDVKGGIHLANAAQTDFRIREILILKNKPPTLLSDGSYSKNRLSAVYISPFILASGKIAFDLIRMEREIHPEVSAAAALEHNLVGAQVLSASAFATFWSGGNLSFI